MSNDISLVAGEGTPGFLDGEFYSALFKTPMGITATPDGRSIFVADTLNNRIREVHLDKNNRVTTLAGHDEPGHQDGSFGSALFNQPQGVLYLDGDRLAVNDSGNSLLRLVDLKKRRVTTLGGGSTTPVAEGPAGQVSMAGIRSMAYLAVSDSIYYTQPDQRSLKRLNLKTGQVTYVLNNHPGLVHPTVLCASVNNLYVANQDDTQIFRLEGAPEPNPVLILAATSVGPVMAMASRGDNLYAIQAGLDSPLERLLPLTEPMTYTSPVSGETASKPGFLFPPLEGLDQYPNVGLVVDPMDSHKLFLSTPRLNIISSYRDLIGIPENGEYELGYPEKKPPRTFRILISGDSRAVMISNFQNPTSIYVQIHDKYPRQISLTHQLSWELNMRGSIEDSPVGFEVMNVSHSASVPLFLWPLFELPDLVHRYDIDLVLIMEPTSPEGFNPFYVYYDRPLNADGIPVQTPDPEYLLKPPLDRIPPGSPRRFYDYCAAKGLVKIDGNNLDFKNGLMKDPQLQDSLIQMYGHPIDRLRQKIEGLRTSAGKPVRFIFCFSPTAILRPNSVEAEFWRALTDRYHIKFLNLHDDMTVLRLSNFPIAENGGNDHYNIAGHLFFGRMLADVLIHGGYIPWGKAQSRRY